MKRRPYSMLQGPLLPSIISYAIPVVLTSVLQLLFNAVDLIVVGQYCGSNSVAAVGATGSLTSLMVNFFVGFSIGAGANMANAIGNRDHHLMRRIVHTAIAVALSCGVLLTVVGVLMSETFLVWTGTPEDVLPLSAVYMRIYFGGILFTMVYNFSASLLRAAGDTKSPLVFLTISGVTNVVLNLIFVIVFHMDVAGVALATTISQGISAVLTLRALTRREDGCRLSLSDIRFHKEPLLKIVKQGLPAGLQNALFSISNVIIQSSINSFGEVAISGNAAAVSIEGFVYVGMDAFSQSAINFTGQNAGAGQYKRVKKVLWTCLGCVTVAGALLAAVAYVFAPQLLRLYVPDSAAAIEYGILRMEYVCVLYFLCGMMNVCTGVLRGMQVSLLPMLISIVGVCGMRLAWIYTIFQMPQYHTLAGLYVSYPISWTATLLVTFVAALVVHKKRSAACQTLPS